MIRIHIWPPSRDDRSGVLIGTDGMRRSDWPRARRLLVGAQGTIDNARVAKSGHLRSALVKEKFPPGTKTWTLSGERNVHL